MGTRTGLAATMALVLALRGCDDAPSGGGPRPAPSGGPTAVTSTAPATSGQAPVAVALPTAAAIDPNPLGLPPRRVKLDAGRRVFTFSDSMMAGARIGSTLILYSATVSQLDGDDLIIEGRAGPSYKVHAGYVIPVPDDARLRHGDPVVTEWNGVMKHAVVTKLARDKVTVRYTDMDPKTPEGQLRNARFTRQVDGLVAGNYASLTEGDEIRHVLLVSPANDGDKKRWFALGFGGAAMVVDEVELAPIPVKYNPKVGTQVLAEWMGNLRKATVQTLIDPALFTVKFERAGRPATVGWGLLMKDAQATDKAP
jgi:hypothetical protein